ncbi:adenylate/guanylate cyclase domain-containing protein [Synechococcus sp. Cruz-9H2]|uniref:adenylate/guanylate cyclase domain-containing protein n=1 Tax=unclassified Synechococcus TaxID=2626047 RepID=UPI0020CEB5C6|nr:MULTISPECIES: adenylate/guanylate cyclase domain-containing protein [unclassified Synechococcus]MCP9818871.1 adenylate/guanylate cyclase domain-containing protein [Synechococcus sp. Cruz-9H2]MCP9843374.1 adenylate/guanylate cyclase domain-containing protein [Synechococcus sp. Edmonson 11F2]MCP9855243.1 adenylate/guanylate cyclase domain-containing protein [Synechococcus sp. Cruz-9C9]MCP9862784.1 adenylate/guanylate cyclase domain-containing protein [Synechococcus sp. Cruz-7E5]MCP9869781.1 a
MKRARVWWLALALPLVVALPSCRDTSPAAALARFDRLARGTFFRWRGPRPAPRDPLILAIDSESLRLADLLGSDERQASPLWRRMGPWPWPRALQAELAATALRGGARGVLVNIEYSQPSRYGPADDATALALLTPWRDRVHLATGYTLEQGQGLEQTKLRRPVLALGPSGLTALLHADDGVAEAVPGRLWWREQLAGFAPPNPLPMAFLVRPDALAEEPLGLNYRGPAGTLPVLPAWRIQQAQAGIWTGRTVVIGATAAELGDQQETPYGPMSGSEVLATAVGNVLEGDGLRSVPGAAEGLLLLVWGAGVLVLLGRPAAALGTAATAVALMATGLGLAYGLWLWAQLNLPLAALLLAPLLGGGLRVAGQARQELQERAYLHQVLARRISPTLLNDILRNPAAIWNQAGGQRCRCVLLFSDLVDFTPLSAALEPPELFALLNRYFEVMAEAVLAEQGLLDKFIGDAVMAEFGVPRSRGDQIEARAAVRAALAMQRGLRDLNQQLAAANRPPLRHGIGLHVGEVIAGNLGSSQRLEYTVVGASVNVASRLEGLTRHYPQHPILISAELLALLPGELEVEPLGAHQLKGWPEPLEVLALLGLRAPAQLEPAECP